MRPRRLAALLLATMTAACPGSTSPPLPAELPTLVVEPRLAAVFAGQGPIHLRATVSASSDPVTWSVYPDVGTLTAAADGGDYSPPARIARTTSVHLTASAGALTRTVEITVEPVAVEVTPASRTVVAGSGAVTFRANASRELGAVTWSLDPDDPGSGTIQASGAEAHFTPPMSGPSRVVSLVARSASNVEGRARIVVAGEGGISVRGRVVYPGADAGVDGAVVAIGSQTAVTDPTGTFEIDGVIPPYDAAVSDPAGSLTVYEALTQTDPVLLVEESTTFVRAPDHHAVMVSGRIIGATSGPGDHWQVGAHIPGGQGSASAQSNMPDDAATDAPTFGWPLSWDGAPTQTFVFRAFAYHEEGQGFGDYRYGTRVLQVTDGPPITGADITLDFPVPTRSVRVTSVWSPMYRRSDFEVLLTFGEGGVSMRNPAGLADGSTELLLPDFPGAVVRLSLRAVRDVPPVGSGVAEKTVPHGVTEVSLQVPPPAVLVRPASGSSVGSRPSFEWTTPRGGASVLEILCSEGPPCGPHPPEWMDWVVWCTPPPNHQYRVYTAATSWTWPEAVPALLPGSVCSWSVGWHGEELDPGGGSPDGLSSWIGVVSGANQFEIAPASLPGLASGTIGE